MMISSWNKLFGLQDIYKINSVSRVKTGRVPQTILLISKIFYLVWNRLDNVDYKSIRHKNIIKNNWKFQIFPSWFRFSFPSRYIALQNVIGWLERVH